MSDNARVTLYVWWCPICEQQFERMHHITKRIPLFPQLDEYHTCVKREVVFIEDARIDEFAQAMSAVGYARSHLKAEPGDVASIVAYLYLLRCPYCGGGATDSIAGGPFHGLAFCWREGRYFNVSEVAEARRPLVERRTVLVW